VNKKEVPNLTKASLAHMLEEKIDIEPHLAISIVEHFFEEIIQSLEKNEPVKLVGLGELSVVSKNSKTGRNPKTGEETIISPRRAVKFKISATLRKILNQLSLPTFGV
jgi:integration host factor subunit alpha